MIFGVSTCDAKVKKRAELCISLKYLLSGTRFPAKSNETIKELMSWVIRSAFVAVFPKFMELVFIKI